MTLLTVDEVVALHKKLVSATGGSHGIRDIGLVESAIYSAIQTFDETEVYPTLEEKAARLAFSLTKNHGFIDGNKRIGVFVMLMTLRLNGIELDYSQNDLIKLGLGIADGTLGYEQILEWILAHKQTQIL